MFGEAGISAATGVMTVCLLSHTDLLLLFSLLSKLFKRCVGFSLTVEPFCLQVAILLLTEITPKSVAVHNATEVARFVVR